MRHVLGRAITRRTALKAGTAGAASVALPESRPAVTRADRIVSSKGTPESIGESGMLTDVPGFLVGNVTMESAITGCTVILYPPGTTAGVEVLGGWPATREMAILSPLSSSPFIHAILFTGRSVYGLAAADGVVRWIEENRNEIPQVPGAVINDLGMGNTTRRPGAEEGFRACVDASDVFTRGSVGAGTGATVGKGRGPNTWMKGGLGSASLTFEGGGVVAALAVVNAVGDVIGADGRILAGAHDADGGHIDFASYVQDRPFYPEETGNSNTTLIAVATNANLTKTQCSVVAHMAQAGLARAISPIYTPWDGDTVIVASNGDVAASEFAVGIMAAEAVSASIRDAVLQAESRGGVPDLATPGTRNENDPAWSLEG